ncbi:MAG: molybdopterin-dependent oxidoreductase, partial [Nitrososphaerales archaeon]
MPDDLQDKNNLSKHSLRKIRSACSLCQNFCGLFAYVDNGQVVKLEGDPDNPRNRGHLCAKGLSGFMNMYSPERIRRPLLRTNPEKGLDVNPGWKEILWEEALSIVAQKFKAVIQNETNKASTDDSKGTTSHDPLDRLSKRVILDTFDHWASYSGAQAGWAKAINAHLSTLSAECFCGNAVHPPSYMNTATFEITVDPEYSKYVLLIGAQAGSIIHYDTMNVARHIAANRPGGIKVVVVDPMSGFAASKAEEWIPIRPGTDAAFILCIANLLLNEYKIYDAEFLKKKTNAPYLIGDDGLYVRDEKSGKPLVWDSTDNISKTFDDSSIKDYDLDGSHTLGGRSCRTALQAIKQHISEYTPDSVSKITTIPPDTIRKIAKELGDSACIGQTINIDGIQLPYRPVSIVWYRGLSAHRHSFLAGFAAIMLPTILGAVQVPGGIQGAPPVPEYVTDDGLMAPKPTRKHGVPYPNRPVTHPNSIDAFELFPVAVYSKQFLPAVLSNPESFGIDPKKLTWPEIMLIFRDNPVNNTYSPDEIIRGLSKIPFIVSFNIDLDETANSLADLVFPDLHHLEKLGEGLYSRVAEPGYWYGAKPVARPPFDPPWDKLVSNSEIFLEIAKRVGFVSRVYSALNELWNMKGTQYELDPEGTYTIQEIADRRLKAWLGPDKGIDWFMKDDGGLIVWKAKVEEVYKGAFRSGRIHIYYEFMLHAKKELNDLIGELGIRWDTSDYQAVPDWKPCPAYSNKNGKFNLFLINAKMPIMAHSFGRFNPVPMQLVNARKHLVNVLMNPQ